MKFGDELLQSAKEALAIAQGQAEPPAVFVPAESHPEGAKKKPTASLLEDRPKG